MVQNFWVSFQNASVSFCMHLTGAITSTANDMARWMNMLLSGGLNKAGEEIFSSDVIFETRTQVNAYSANPDNLYRPPSYVNHHFKMHYIVSFHLVKQQYLISFVVVQSATNIGHPMVWVFDKVPTGSATIVC